MTNILDPSVFLKIRLNIRLIFACLICTVGILGLPNGISLIFPAFNYIATLMLIASFLYAMAFPEYRFSKRTIILLVAISGVMIWSLMSLVYATDPFFGLRIYSSALFKVMLFITLIILIQTQEIFFAVIRVIFYFGVYFSLTGVLLTYLIVFKNLPSSDFIGDVSLSKSMSYDQNLYYYSGLGFVRASTSLLDLVFPRLQSFFIEPGYFSFFLEGSLFSSLVYLNLVKTRFRKRFVITGISLQLLALLFSFSFAGIVSVIVGYFFYYAISRQKSYWQSSLVWLRALLLWGGLALFILYLINSTLFIGLYNSLIADHFTQEKGLSSADERKIAFDTGWKLFLKNPVIGVGFNQVRVVSGGMGTNNSFLTVAAETGAIGLFFYALFMMGIGYVIGGIISAVKFLDINLLRAGAGLVAAIIAQTFHFLFSDTNWSFHYWIMLAMLCSYYQLIKLSPVNPAFYSS